jgi:ABC-type uncharacterized transport system permease subunit
MLVSWLLGSNVTEASELVFLNAQSSIVITLAGIVMLVSELAPENALSPMLVTPAGITTAPAQSLPKVTTLSVMSTDPLPLQLTVAALAGLKTSPAMAKAKVVIKIAMRRI